MKIKLASGLFVSGLALAACQGELGSSALDKEATELPTGGAGANSGASGLGGGFNPGVGGGDGEACAALVLEPQTVPVSMFITVDKSGSMGNDGKWNNTRQAFSSFFTDDEADGLNVAMRFWPDGSCTANDCQPPGNGCEQPQVDMGSLADMAHEDALVTLFNSKSPGGITPTEAALSGALEYAVGYQTAAEAGEQVVVILVTDGEPTACNESTSVIASYAQQAFMEQGILTFAVGLAGSNEGQMDQIAQAGGTSQGYFIGNSNTEEALLQALKDIQDVAVACTFAMPESDDPDKPVDPHQVNVLYSEDDADSGTKVPKVADESECGPQGGWYYDDPQDPAVIYLCESTCDAANSTDTSSIGIEVGCQTVVN